MRVYAISGDPPDSLEALQDQLGLAVTLVSDTSREAIPAFGMRDPKGLPRENTARAGIFVIDRQGKVARRWLATNYRKRLSADEILRQLVP